MKQNNCMCKTCDGSCCCTFDISPATKMNQKPPCIYCNHVADTPKKDFSFVTDDGNTFQCYK